MPPATMCPTLLLLRSVAGTRSLYRQGGTGRESKRANTQDAHRFPHFRSIRRLRSRSREPHPPDKTPEGKKVVPPFMPQDLLEATKWAKWEMYPSRSFAEGCELAYPPVCRCLAFPFLPINLAIAFLEPLPRSNRSLYELCETREDDSRGRP